MNERAKPFSNNTEYEIFKYNYCDKCQYHKEIDGYIAAPVEYGGCPIEEDLENARADISLFPRTLIKKRDCNGNVIKYQHCIYFATRNEENKELLRKVNSTTDVQEACAIGFSAGYEAGRIAKLGNACERCAYKSFAEKIGDQNNCINCGKERSCKDKPKIGEYCRINCKDWISFEELTRK